MLVRPQLAYPGVYIQEVVPESRAIAGVATSVTAFLGRAKRGPVDEPVDVYDMGAFSQVFGGMGVDYPLSYALRDFFQAGGQHAVVVRLFNTPDATVDPVARLKVTTEAGARELFELTATDPGSWANGLRASVESSADGRFDLRLTCVDEAGRVLEQEDHPDVTMVLGERRALDGVLEADSVLARLRGVAADSDPPPAGASGAVAEPDRGVDSAPLKIADYASTEAGEGLNALDAVDLVNLLCIPPDTRDGDTDPAVYAAAAAYAERRRAFVIIDGPASWDASARAGNLSDITPADLNIGGDLRRCAAVYFPRVMMADPELGDAVRAFPVSGMVAGIYSRTDAARGVWKAPAGLDAGISGIRSLTHRLTDAENGLLNPLGINCLRTFPVTGTVVWGARTLAGNDGSADDYRYVPVRRTALFLAESLSRGTRWAVFEPNDEPLWAALRAQVRGFMDGLFRQGAFQGSTAKDAYFVRCDSSTMTQTGIDLGVVNLVVGFAALKPAEFVVLYIRQHTAAPGA